MNDGCDGKDEEAGGVAILRMKFMGAFGFASAREKRPAVADDGGNGCCGYTVVRNAEEVADCGREVWEAVVVGGKIGRLG